MLSPKFTVLGSEANAGKAASLLLHFNGVNGSATFKDSSPNAIPVATSGNAQLSSTQSRFGNASGYFDGSNGNTYALVSENAALDMGAANWTLEFWAYFSPQSTAYPSWVGTKGNFQWQAGDFGVHWGQFADRINVVWFDNFLSASVGTASTQDLISQNTFSANQWRHVAVTRAQNTVRLFVDGVLEAEGVIKSGSTLNMGFGGGLMVGGSWDGADGAAADYIDELRIVKDFVAYTGSFTPPPAPLSSYVKVSRDASLLLHMDGSNGSTAFVDSSVNAFPVTADGAAQLSTAQSKFGGASGVFNGSNAQLTIPHSSVLDFGDGDFTVEAWVYLNDNTSSTFFATGSNSGWFFGQSGGEYPAGGVGFGRKGVNWDVIDQSAGRLPTNQWIHLAVTRSGATLRTFVNGALTASATTSASFNVDGSTLYIGSHGGFMYFNGYLDEFRVVKGLAVYTGPFMPPTAPLSPDAKSVPIAREASLLLHMDGANESTSFTDSSVNALTVTANGDAQISTAQSKWGGSSGCFDGDGDFLETEPASALAVGGNDFTIEFWTWLFVVGGAQAWLRADTGTANEGLIICMNDPSDGGVVVQLVPGDESSAWDINSGDIFSPVMTEETWHHIAVSRQGNTWRAFVDGVQIWTTEQSGSVYQPAGGAWRIGSINTDGFFLNGFIDDFRVVKGLAVYTGPFIPPTAPLQALAKPVPPAKAASLLLPFDTNFSDGSANAIVPTVLGDPDRVYVSLSESKFGGAALRTESDNYAWYGALSYQSSDLILGTSDFTVELWFYSTNSSQAAIIWDSNSTDCAGDGFMFLIGDPAETIGFRYVGCYGAAYGYTAAAANQWHHVAASRRNGVLKTFLNGVEFGTQPPLVTLTHDTAVVGGVALYGPTWAFFDGYIDDVRVTKGLALYTDTFTPPTRAAELIAVQAAPSTPTPLPFGTLLYAECVGNDFVGFYANGFGGVYTEIISAGSCA